MAMVKQGSGNNLLKDKGVIYKTKWRSREDNRPKGSFFFQITEQAASWHERLGSALLKSGALQSPGSFEQTLAAGPIPRASDLIGLG